MPLESYGQSCACPVPADAFALAPRRGRRQPRLTLRIPQRTLAELQQLAAAAGDAPVATVAGHLLTAAIADAVDGRGDA